MADKPALIWRAFIALCAVLAIGDFVIHRHAYFALEGMPLFFVIYGALIVGVLYALHGAALRLLARPANRPAEPSKGERHV